MDARRLAILSLPLGLLALGTSCSYSYNIDFELTLDEAVAALDGDLIFEAPEGREVVAHTAGTTSYQQRVTTCCGPKPVGDIVVYLDVDGSGALDEGEPVVAHPDNPVTVSEGMTVVLTLEAG